MPALIASNGRPASRRRCEAQATAGIKANQDAEPNPRQ